MAAPGTTLNEIDSTGGTTEVQPSGRSAGVIGPASQGAAFVPISFANNSQFRTEFGFADSNYHSPLALNQWLNNSSAGTYVRTLGIGDGKKRTTSSPNSGRVNNAGFVVGSQKVQAGSGQLGNNSYATALGSLGRTYFLGCYMSESAGSWVLSDAGAQTTTAAQPIVRGVLFAASGVQIAVSSSAPGVDSTTYSTAATTASPARGWFTGSLDLRSGKQDFVILLNGHTDSAAYPSVLSASFDVTSDSYFAKKFNTDPLLVEQHGYVLYNHYDILPAFAVPTGSGVAAESLIRRFSTAEALEEIVFCLTGSQSRNAGSTTVPNYDNFEDRFQHPSTPFIASQNFGGSRYDLFRIHARGDGAYTNELYKIAIENIKYPTTADGYGKFTVNVRAWDDTDDAPRILEGWVDCDLDPDSSNFIGKKIGDQNTYFDFDRSADAQKIVEEGLYGKKSRRIRVELSEDVLNKIVPTNSLPVAARGYYHLVTSGTNLLSTGSADSSSHLNVPITNAREFPVFFRRSINEGAAAADPNASGASKYYWGPQFNICNSLTQPNDGTTVASDQLGPSGLSAYTKYFPSFHTTYLNPWVGNNAGAADVNGSVLDADLFNKNLFTLERVQVMTGTDGTIDSTRWDEAVYRRNAALVGSEGRFVDVNLDFQYSSNRTYLKFVTFMQGGFDGLNVFDADKFYMRDAAIRREMDNTNQGQLDGPTVAAYRKAVDIMANKTYSDVSLLAIPDVRHPSVTDFALSSMQTKFDALYIMDVELKDDNNNYVTSSLASNVYPSVNIAYTTTRFRARSLNNSFGAAYFPDLFVNVDPGTGVSSSVRVPASTMVLGAYGQNDRLAHAWYAPAGYIRAVIPAEELSTKFLAENVDTVYDAGINPIIAPPGAGIIVNGQRTLLAEGSALDRVNVRRLLIEVRRRVKAVAYGLLFEPNRESTIARFNALVTPIMKQIQAQRGVERYRVQIDTTTTTQADIENNTIRGKIYLQPTRSAEFISIDFEARNAASF
jgi:hypothetical protein